METLNFKLAALLHNLFSFALVYGMDGICEICDHTIGRNAILPEYISSLRWACSSVRRRLVADLEKYPSERKFNLGDMYIYDGLVDMTKLEIELDLI